jgi:hypothetical protein
MILYTLVDINVVILELELVNELHELVLIGFAKFAH